MTKSEYFEKNKVSFAEAMKLFNEQKKFKSFDKFLASNHIEHKFKVGDLAVLQLNKETKAHGWAHNVVFEIVNASEGIYDVKFLTPTGCNVINAIRMFTISFIDKNCILY